MTNSKILNKIFDDFFAKFLLFIFAIHVDRQREKIVHGEKVYNAV